MVGTLVLSIGLPWTLRRSTGWAPLGVGAGEGLVGIVLLAVMRLNILRAVAGGLLLGGAAAFVYGLNIVY